MGKEGTRRSSRRGRGEEGIVGWHPGDGVSCMFFGVFKDMQKPGTAPAWHPALAGHDQGSRRTR